MADKDKKQTTPPANAKDEKAGTEFSPAPDQAEVFKKVLISYRPGIKIADAIVNNIVQSGDKDVFSNINKLNQILAMFPAEIPATYRQAMLKQWAGMYGLDVPPEVAKEPEKSESKVKTADELKGSGSSTPAEKYTVSTETGDIEPATTDTKYPLTLSEAERVSGIKKKEIAQRKKEAEKEADANKETPFIFGEDGSFSLNSKAKITMQDLYLFNKMNDDKARGELEDPLKYYTTRMQELAMLREVAGGGNQQTSLLDIMTALEKMKTLSGGDPEVKQLLQTLVTKLTTTPETPKEDPRIAELMKSNEELKNALNAKKDEELKETLTAFKTEITNIRSDMSRLAAGGNTRAEYGVMHDFITTIDNRAKSIEGMFRTQFASLPKPMPPEEKSNLMAAISEQAAASTELDALANELFFKKG